MSRNSNLKETLLQQLESEIRVHGFSRAKRRDQSFERPCELGRESLHVAFIPHEWGFYLTADIAIRIDELEDVMNEYRPWLSNREKKEIFSMGCELGNLRDGRQLRWRVTSAEDVEEVVASLIATFEEIALPFFERFSTQEAAFDVLVGDSPTAWLYAPSHDDRARAAVVLGHLLGRDLEPIIAQKEQFLSSQGKNVEKFREFASDFREESDDT